MARPRRKGPKNSRRAGCLLCKPWKRVGCKRKYCTVKEQKARLDEREQEGGTDA